MWGEKTKVSYITRCYPPSPFYMGTSPHAQTFMPPSPSEMPHVVLFPYPAQGHINPMMQLAKRLASHGISITFVTLEYFISLITQSQHTHFSSSQNGIRLMGIPDGLPKDYNRNALDFYAAAALENLDGALEKVLLDLLVEQPITCVIGDCYLSRLRHVANKLKLPRILFWPQCATSFAMHYHVDEIVAHGFDPFQSPVKPGFGPNLQSLDLITCLPGVSPIHPAFLPFGNPFGVLGLQWTSSFIAQQFGNLHEVFWMIGNAVEILEPQTCNAIPKFQPIGPLIPFAFLGEEDSHDTRTGTSLWKEDDCIQWLDMQPASSVLYVSFGSLMKFSIAQIQEIAFGLLASKHRFLWVIRPSLIVEDVQNILEALPESFADETKERGRLISWAPQALVLAHTAVGGFFSHCGWNSTLESICMGVPLLGWPQMFDQLTNCWLAANEWKIGIALKTDEDNKTDRGEVERAVRLLMEGEAAEEIRTRAAKLRDATRKAIKDDVGSSRIRLQLLVEELFRMAGDSSVISSGKSF